jgi:hypothetical protein
MPAWRRTVAAVLAVAAVATGCGRAAPDPTVRPRWLALTLPMPPGESGRLMVRDAAVCADRWYVVGAVATAAGDTRPAAWSTGDPQGARGGAPVPIAAESYYGVRSILYAVGCREGRIAAIGAKAGGAHGNPRVRTWYQRPDGALAEVISTDFELYGGPTAVSVSRIAGGADGWLIAGNRESGAAVWVSPDATAFEILEGAASLASDAALATAAADASAVPGGWLVAGSGHAAGHIDRDPLAWTSPDGRRWTRVPLPGTGDDEVAQRLVRTATGVLAVGVRGGGFGAWRGDASGATGWRAAGRFGATGTGAVAGVESVAVLADPARVLAATTAAEGHRLWSADPAGAAWQPVDLPLRLPSGGYTAAAVAARGGTVVLAADDGVTGGAWMATITGRDLRR